MLRELHPRNGRSRVLNAKRVRRRLLSSLLAIGSIGLGAWAVAQQPGLVPQSIEPWLQGPQVAQSANQGNLDSLPSAPFDRYSPSPFAQVRGAADVAGATPTQPSTQNALPDASGPLTSGPLTRGPLTSGSEAQQGLVSPVELYRGSRRSAQGTTADQAASNPAPIRSKTIDARSVARQMIDDAVQLADQGDVYRARHLAQQAARFPVKWEAGDVSPADLLQRLDEMPQDAETGLVATFGSARSKVIYPAMAKEQIDAVRRLPSATDGELASVNPPNANADELGGMGGQAGLDRSPAQGGSSKVIEFSLPLPFRKPNWDTPPSQQPSPEEQGLVPPPTALLAAGNGDPGLAPPPQAGPRVLPLTAAQPIDVAGRSVANGSQAPAIGGLDRVGSLRRGTYESWGPSPEAYRQSQYRSDSGTKVIDSRHALEARQLEMERMELERLDLEHRRDELFRAAAEAQRQIEFTSYQQPRPPLGATPPQLLRIEAAGTQAAAFDQSFWINQAPLITFFLGLLLCPLTLALCFAVVVKQITRHQGPLLQVEFSGNGRPDRRRTRRARDEEDDDDLDERSDDHRRRTPVRKQRPKRRGPTRRTAFVDPLSADASHRLPPLPGMNGGEEERQLQEQRSREQEQAILQHVYEQNLELRQQLRTLNDQNETQ